MIALTKAERKWVEWALDVMGDHWCTDNGAWERGDPETGELGPVYDDADLPRLERGGLVVAHVPAPIVGDLLYRLEEQAPATAETDAVSEAQIVNRSAPALRAAAKIRSARPDVEVG